jgi:hypothetical protein
MLESIRGIEKAIAGKTFRDYSESATAFWACPYRATTGTRDAGRTSLKISSPFSLTRYLPLYSSGRLPTLSM